METHLRAVPVAVAERVVMPLADTAERTPADDSPALGWRNIIVACALFVVALGGSWAVERLSGANVFRISAQPQYIYQADAFLHGRWDLNMPAWWTDIVVLHGKHYIVYPPFPAVLMMPVVAIFGVQGTSDVFFTLVVAAAGLSALYLTLEQTRANGWTQRSWRGNLAISFFLFYGSITLTLSLGGRMWFTAHIICFVFTLLSLLLALRRHYGWSALLLACAVFSRATAAVGFPFLFYLAWEDGGAQPTLARFVASLRSLRPDLRAIPLLRLLPPTLVTLAALALYGARDAIIFGSPLETGYAILIQQRYPVVTDGPFNLRYIPVNIIANFFTFPSVRFSGPFDRHPIIDMLNGGFAVSVFVTTPLFLYLFWRNRRFSAVRAALWSVIILDVVIVLVFHASGYYQFGARYLFDAYPYAFVLLATTNARLDWRFIALGAIGVAINVVGAHQFWPGVGHHEALQPGHALFQMLEQWASAASHW